MRRSSAGGWVGLVLGLGAFWMILTDQSLTSWIVGGPALLLAVATYRQLGSVFLPRLRWSRLPGFALWFLGQSLRGGIDVARRALKPQTLLHPGFVHVSWCVVPGPGHIFLINCLNLLPGTLSVRADGTGVLLHVLDTRGAVAEEVAEVERRVEQLFVSSEEAGDG